MRQRGYAIAFVLVLLAACAGGFFGGSFLIRRLQQDFGSQAAWTPPTAPVPASVVPPTPGPSEAVASVPATVAPTRVVITVPAPTDVETPTPEIAAPEATPTETETASPSPSPLPAFPYVMARPVRHSSGDCPGNYIQGTVSDRAGRPLPDVRLLLADEYGNQEVQVTKTGSDAGRYDFPLFGPPRRFYLSVVDASGRPISPKIEIPHGVGANPQAQCHWADWQRQ
jgi:hypothetical protein